jgi:isoleucyl-tRNA synthetase
VDNFGLDMINRYKLMRGYRVSYVPGWDCHGLPIELKALESLMKQKKKSTSELTGKEIRKVAKDWAQRHIELQMKDFKRWGIMADWTGHYATYAKEYEAEQIKVFRQLFEKGLIFRALKPVFWSPSSRTALAESELEYVDDHKSTSAYVKYSLTSESKNNLLKHLGMKDEGDKVSAVIWTTTPWTLPGSLAIAFGSSLDYSIVKYNGELLIVASYLVGSVLDGEFQSCHNVKGEEIGSLSLEALHPFFDRVVPLLPSEFVVADSGTGLVHSAPAHGQEDFIVCQRHGLDVFNCVTVSGTFNDLAGDRLVGKKVILRIFHFHSV